MRNIKFILTVSLVYLFSLPSCNQSKLDKRLVGIWMPIIKPDVKLFSIDNHPRSFFTPEQIKEIEDTINAQYSLLMEKDRKDEHGLYRSIIIREIKKDKMLEGDYNPNTGLYTIFKSYPLRYKLYISEDNLNMGVENDTLYGFATLDPDRPEITPENPFYSMPIFSFTIINNDTIQEHGRGGLPLGVDLNLKNIKSLADSSLDMEYEPRVECIIRTLYARVKDKKNIKYSSN